MKIYEGMASIVNAKLKILEVELRRLIGERTEELSEFAEFDAPSFIKMIVLEPGDAPRLLDDALGFSFFQRNCDAIENHGEWLELTLVLSDDGAGVILFIPKNSRTDQSILNYCFLQLEMLLP